MNLNPLKKLHKARKINTFENFIKSIKTMSRGVTTEVVRDQKCLKGGTGLKATPKSQE
jgi:hypothetical protein